MHLTKIKLAGFKSFVDPTVVPLRSNRTAVVGPNGCGKSNIIDAVRWVMGESSAKQLRGEAMADVIFNGTTARKPVGQASIELFFDNSDASLGGEYAKYNEIGIRREVNRDGLSNYYINNARCRRKDIVDIFLDTGLGPRGYAIIEQGMISRLIEAKPDELRVYLEEAAGISKYKERRRETESRIRATRDNLDRLNDILQELDKQLRHLKRQANAAKHYTVLKQQQRSLKAQLQALHWRVVEAQIEEQNQALKQHELLLEEKLAQQSKLQLHIEQLHIDQNECNDAYNEVQGRFYSLGAEIGKVEQQIQHCKERTTQLNQDLLHLNRTWEESQHHISSDKNKITTLQQELGEVEPQIAEKKQIIDKVTLELAAAEETMNEWQIAWDSFTDTAAKSAQRAEVEQTRINHIEQRIEHESTQLEKLLSEQQRLDFTALPEEINVLQSDCSVIQQQNSELQNQLTDLQQQIAQQREQHVELTSKLNSSCSELQKLHGRKSSLDALQQDALGKRDTQVNAWLKQHDLHNNKRLAEGLVVEPGWEKAVETVLSSHLDAVCVKDVSSLVNALSELKEGSVALFNSRGNAENSALFNANTLASKVGANSALQELLSTIYIAEELTHALTIHGSLKPHESVVTREGIWLSPYWVCVNSTQDANSGVLQREREIKQLTQQITDTEQNIILQEEQLSHAKSHLGGLEKNREELQQKFAVVNSQYSIKYGELTAKQAHLEQMQQRAKRIAQEIVEHEQRLVSAREQLQTVRDIWQEAEQNKLSDDERRQVLVNQREQHKVNLDEKRKHVAAVRQQANELNMQNEFAHNQIQYLQQSVQRSEKQVNDLQQRKEELVKVIADTESPLSGLSDKLEQLLNSRLAVETELTAAKSRVDEVEHQLRTAEKDNTDLQNAAQQMRDQMSQVRMEIKAFQVRASTYVEQINEAGFELQPVLDELTEDTTIDAWDEKLAHITRRIERMGPINLAAIDEYTQNLERKKYLDAQQADLTQALETLENAIRRIDRETKERFKATFNLVNEKFTALFPLVFGGGRASLELVGEDLLSTGVNIIAQPPGKRNATIHLLSGGEKALTAIALVFAIFQLNPAPFCMLDEVDAPLDDNNVVRFSNLVKEMAETIQIIFITHNKITMEIADQLIGVTMQEPGVSRIVAVDIQQAIEMAQA